VVKGVDRRLKVVVAVENDGARPVERVGDPQGRLVEVTVGGPAGDVLDPPDLARGVVGEGGPPVVGIGDVGGFAGLVVCGRPAAAAAVGLVDQAAAGPTAARYQSSSRTSTSRVGFHSSFSRT